MKSRTTVKKLTRKIIQPLIILALFTGNSMMAQPDLPVVILRFANPQYICPTQTYCVDVEFKCNVPDQWVYGVNIRFLYDDSELEYLGISDIQTGYITLEPPQIITGPANSGDPFGFAGPVEWFNGQLQLVDYNVPVYLTSDWIKMFKICFHVDNPNSLNIKNFCPSIVWDLKQPNRAPLEDGDGFFPGDDGVVVTVVDNSGLQDSSPTFESVEQFNWQYSNDENSWGFPVSQICVTTICGYIIPLSDWSLYLAIGLMVILSIFIYRKRISG